MNCGSDRLNFIEQRRGKDATLSFAKQTLRIYRKSVLTSRKRGHEKPHYASLPEYRKTFIESYLAFKLYIKHNDIG